MILYIIKRIFYLFPLTILKSILSFIIIQLPPGDYVTEWEYNMIAQGYNPTEEEILMPKEKHHLDKTYVEQYIRWTSNIVFYGDFGVSFTYNKLVSDILSERVPRTIALSLGAILVQWIIAVPIEIFSAVRKYSMFDYFFTLIGFIGISIQGFIFAIILIYLLYVNTGYTPIELGSETFGNATWDINKFYDLMKNISIPLTVLGSSGAAVIIRI